MAKYQYETSPRKVKTEYETTKKKKQVNVEPTKKQINHKKPKKMLKAKVVFYIIIGFAMFFTISYRNAVIDMKYAQIKELKTNLSNAKKENEQLKANVEQALNLKAVQEEAQNHLGMKTLSTNQIEYINLSKKDHIESNIQVEENKNFFEKAVEFIKKIIK